MEWENAQHSQHKLGNQKIELIPAKILDCSERTNQESKIKIIDNKKYQNDPISKFNIHFAMSIRNFDNSKRRRFLEGIKLLYKI